MSFAIPLAALILLTPEAPYDPEDASNPDYAARTPRYELCVEAVDAGWEGGRAFAHQWISAGGGAPAEHCLAVAYLAGGRPKAAAVKLLELSERPDVGDVLVKARILEQAALAFLEAGERDFAVEAAEAARQLAPNAGEISLTAGVVYAAIEAWEKAVEAVSAAEGVGVVSVDGYIARARAYYSLAKTRQAAEDVVEALKRDPTHLDALVLRGDLQQAGVEIDANYQRAPQPAQTTR